MPTLILTIAGLSTRFGNSGPKWLLTHPSGRSMAAASIAGLNGYQNLVVAARSEHIKQYGRGFIYNLFEHVQAPVTIIDVGNTESHVETVQNAIVKGNVTSPFVTKDCDGYFELSLHDGNYVVFGDLIDIPLENKEKGFLTINEHYETVTTLVEKERISSMFLAGGYGFKSPNLFLRYSPNKMTVSSVIQAMIKDGNIFDIVQINKFDDWGTQEDWNRFLLK